MLSIAIVLSSLLYSSPLYEHSKSYLFILILIDIGLFPLCDYSKLHCNKHPCNMCYGEICPYCCWVYIYIYLYSIYLGMLDHKVCNFSLLVDMSVFQFDWTNSTSTTMGVLIVSHPCQYLLCMSFQFNYLVTMLVYHNMTIICIFLMNKLTQFYIFMNHLATLFCEISFQAFAYFSIGLFFFSYWFVGVILYEFSVRL